MPAPTSLVQSDASLTPLARQVLHAVTGVSMPLLEEVRIRPASRNWLRAPWYGYRRGGAMTIGRTIWFTRKWFDAPGYGDGTITATWHWLCHLAHEAGHLPQAERFGRGVFGTVGYVAAFAWQYGSRTVLMRRDVHDGAPLEIEADRGRWVLVELIGKAPSAHPLVRAVHAANVAQVREECERLANRVIELTQAYTRR